MLLSTRGLSKNFAGLRAVEDVDFDLPKGEIRALIGPNGAGKTTLVGMISGRIAPSAGRVSFDGQDITALPAHRRMQLGMAYTFQITSVFGRLSVRENVALAARRHLHGAAVETAVDQALARVGLAERAGQEAGGLAYGHQRLLEIAMGLAQSPRLLILDEPTQGLAEGEIDSFLRLIREVAQEATILLIEHNMRVVMDLADRITVLDGGRVLAEGTPAEIHANRAVQAAYLGGVSDAAAG
ncbi:leucine/isoleucine/valine transporter subunit; ATP-binding component of ABC superfamily [Roseovarius sp. EC-HK134]|uniref:ABC transporter ATP-binding protein n=1 Tax=unclassified Roseovarius TaxID=2614913 RepID=UPI001250D21A|nr:MULTISPECIES: ABC transporter ATP-binding protein [unclassified Roseovarius]VVT13850.1 leucine/isoleucine/valine transporter subunit; ATP-binding component of ABC superfamily [Roseovarius sp. EC-SD190]VVT14861.1 leucine/isoleucine/valine transporter subunit; ATP-binding component of ABC superfamily [Roseovarius sp. EC-HK134]